MFVKDKIHIKPTTQFNKTQIKETQTKHTH